MDEKAKGDVIEALLKNGYSLEDTVYAVRRLRPILGTLQVGRLLGRKMTEKERKRAHVLLTDDQSPQAVADALTKP